MQKINLKTDDSTIHVDDVRVEDGVYARHTNGSIFHHELVNGSSRFRDYKGVIYYEQDNLLQNVKYNEFLTFFTIPDNKRIVTEKELSVDDVMDGDHIGSNGSLGKGHVLYVGLKDGIRKFAHVLVKDATESACNPILGSDSNLFPSISELIKHTSKFDTVTELYRFPTRQQLYKWLSEE